MANIKNFGIQGVGSDVQFGKGGNRLVSNSGVFSVLTSANAAAEIAIANATSLTHAVSLAQLNAVAATAQAADQALQSEISNTNANVAALQTEVDAVETAVGLNADGTFAALAGTYVSTATSIKSAIEALDVAAKATADALEANSVAQQTAIDTLVANAETQRVALEALDANASAQQTAIEALVANSVEQQIAIANAANASTAGLSSLQAEVDAIETAVGLNADGSFASMTGTYVANATSVKSAVEALDVALAAADAAAIANAAAQQTRIEQNASDLAAEVDRATTKEADLQTQITTEVSRATAAEGALSNAITIETVRAQGEESKLSNAITAEVTRAEAAEEAISDDLDAEIVRAKAAEDAINANVATLSDRVTALGSVFNYAGTLDGTALDLDALPASGKDVGDYYKVTGEGPITFTYNAGADTIVVNQGDGIVKSATGWDKIDNTNSAVFGTANFVDVSGSSDTGYTVNLSNVFVSRISSLEEKTSVDTSDLQAQIDALESNVAAEVARIDGVDAAQNAALALEANARAAGDSLNAQAISDEANARTAADTLISGNLANAVTEFRAADLAINEALTAVNTAYQAADTLLGQRVDGANAALTNAVTLIGETINTVNAAYAAADAVIAADLANVATNVSAIQAELDATQTGAGLAANGSYVANASSNYLASATSLKDADDKLDAAVKALSADLSNLSQDQIQSANTLYSVKTTNSAVETYGDKGGVKTLFMNAVTGAAQDSTITLSTAVAGEVRMEAHSGTATDVDIRLIPQGEGQVIVGDQGTDGVIQADDGYDLILSGGDNAAGAPGNLVLAGGAGDGANGVVSVKTSIEGDTIATFEGSSAGSNLKFSSTTNSVVVAAAGSAADLDVVLAPKGTGSVDASNAKIAHVANATNSHEAVNLGQLTSAVASAQTAATSGSHRTVTASITENTGTIVVGSVHGTAVRVKVVVSTAFSAGAAITVGTASVPAELVSAADVDEAAAGMYIVELAKDYASATNVVVSVTAGSGSAGTAKVYVEYVSA